MFKVKVQVSRIYSVNRLFNSQWRDADSLDGV
jgi:hypothetical protein